MSPAPCSWRTTETATTTSSWPAPWARSATRPGGTTSRPTPTIDVQVRGRAFAAHATVLDDEAKAWLWPAIAETIPQMHTYVERTDRNIRVFRLTEVPA